MKELQKAILNLLKIKSLFSLVAMYILIYGIHTGKIDISITVSLVSMIITSYFNKKESEKNE